MSFFARLLPALLLICSIPVHADVTADFQSLLSGLQNMRGDFTQTVTNRNGKTQVSTGSFAIQRPGKFRWNYHKPYEQLIVCDGKEIWLFDPDLDQVTVKSMDKGLDASPAALLSGDNQISKRYTIKALPAREGLNWVDATPKQKDSNFNRIRLGFSGNEIRKMELEDYFNQTTRVDLKIQGVNGKVDAGLFQFTPPKGADIVRQ